MLWPDFDFKEFFGDSQARPSSPQAHKLSYNDLQDREKFLSELQQIHKLQNLLLQIYRLETEVKFFGINEGLIRK